MCVCSIIIAVCVTDSCLYLVKSSSPNGSNPASEIQTVQGEPYSFDENRCPFAVQHLLNRTVSSATSSKQDRWILCSKDNGSLPGEAIRRNKTRKKKVKLGKRALFKSIFTIYAVIYCQYVCLTHADWWETMVACISSLSPRRLMCFIF